MTDQTTDLWPGMLVIQVNSYVREQLNLSENAGPLVIARVEQGSPAAAAGIRSRDVISRVDGRAVCDLLEFYTALVCRKGRVVTLQVQRKGEELVIEMAP